MRAGEGGKVGKLLSLARARSRRATPSDARTTVRAWGHRALADGPLVIAHRGSCRAALENTLEAFRLAREQGADGVELDAMPCASGEIVVFHDDDLRRLAQRPERVAELPLAALREVALAGKHGQGGISTLGEVIEELGPEMLVNVELKTPTTHTVPEWPGHRLAVAVAALLRRHGVGERVLVSSFNPLALARFRVASPFTPSGLLFARDQAWPLRRAYARHLLRPLAVHPERLLVDERALAGWRREGYAVNVWTVDDEAEIARLAALGVDSIITNDPVRTRTLLGA